MRRKAHVMGSILFGLVGFILVESITHSQLPYSGWGLASLTVNSYISLMFMLIFSPLGGILPDILDPPFTAKHRRFAHSKILLFILFIFWLISLRSVVNNGPIVIMMIYYFLIGYISHLSLDSLTPSGLW